MSSVVEYLSKLPDRRNEDSVCEFNGYLEDYLNVIEEDEEKAACYFRKLLELNSDFRIIKNLKISCNKDAIANQIIRYKDAFKLPDGILHVPYLLYVKNEMKECGIICAIGGKDASIYAKGSYFVLSEPGNQYENLRNDLVSLSLNDATFDKQLEVLKRYLNQGDKASYIQRKLDQNEFESLNEMIETATDLSKMLCEDGVEHLKTLEEPRDAIYELIEKWFYLKKFVYVQTMMDRTSLHMVYGDNPKKQRQAAKERADAIQYVSYSECWRRITA